MSAKEAAVTFDRWIGFGGPLRSRDLIALSIGGLLGLSAFWLVAGQSSLEIAREHGPMENLQVAFLVGGLVVLLRHAWHNNYPAQRVVFAGMAWGYFTFLLLEFDVRPFHIEWLTTLLNGTFRNLWLGLGWVALATETFRHRAGLFTAWPAWRRSFSAMMLIGAALFWISGAIAERSPMLHGVRALFIEELLEVNAACLMLLTTFGLETDVRNSQNRAREQKHQILTPGSLHG